MFKILGMKKDYDVIHIHGNSPLFSDIALLLFKMFKKKIVYTYHCDAKLEATTKTSGKITRLIEKIYFHINKLLLKYADVVTFTTDSYSSTRRNRAKRYTIIPSGVDAKFFTAFDNRDFEEKPRSALFVGQLQPYKGVDLLIDAGRDQELLIYIAGKGSLYEYYKRKTQSAKNITMLGYVTDEALLDWYGRVHFIVLPSISTAEAFGLVTLEGMAGGCVPITSDLLGVKDLSSPTGFVFSCGDVNDFSRVLSVAATLSGEELKRRSVASISFSRKFLWDHCVDMYAKLYEIVKNGMT